MATETIFTSQTPNQESAVGGTARMLAMKWKTNATGKRVTAMRVWLPSTGLQTGMRCQLWRAPSTLLQNILLDGHSGTPSSWMPVSGVSVENITPNQDYYAAFFIPSTASGNYPFGNTGGPISNGSITANNIFRNGGTSTDAPNDETFTGGLFFVDITLSDETVMTFGLPVETEAALPMTWALGGQSFTMGLAAETTVALPMSWSGGVVNAICPGDPALSACDLQGIIDTVVSGFPDLCTVERLDWSTPNGFGGTTVTVSSAVSVRCRVQAKIGDLARDAAASGQQQWEYKIFLPPTTVVKPKDRILYGNRTLMIHGIAAPQSEQTFIELFASEVSPSG